MATINIHHQMAILKNIGCPGIFKYYCSEHSLHSRLQDTNKLQPLQLRICYTYSHGQTLTWVADIQ